MNFIHIIKKIFQIILLILAGEAVFILPFVVPRVFRPTVLDVFELSNTELGTCFSVYGVVALVSYVGGGGIADRYEPRYLISAALFMTALGGLYLASYPSFSGLCLLYGYWGFTTIFLFWAAMIKATRLWGGSKRQGFAFGLLDGGRGLVSFLFGLLGIVVFNYFLTAQIELATLMERKVAFENVVYACTGAITIIAVLIVLFLKTAQIQDNTEKVTFKNLIANYKAAVRIPSVYMLMIIILCAYCGYKITDIYSQFANEIMGYNEVDAAQLGANLLGVRIVIGVVVGVLADRFTAGLMMILGFSAALIGAGLFASGVVNGGSWLIFIIAISMTATGVYAIRALYFAAVKEGEIPLSITGTAVGIISLIGYTPDIFMGPLTGYFLDHYDGLLGFQMVFGSLCAFSMAGLVTSLWFLKYVKSNVAE